MKTWRFILEAHRPCHINRSLDYLSKLRAIRHAKLITLTYGNQGLQLRLLLGQHFDLLISQTAQKANSKDKRLRRTSPDRIPSPLATPNYSQSWHEVVTSSQFNLHLSDPHFQDGTMPTLDATTTAGVHVIPRKITPHSNLRSKS